MTNGEAAAFILQISDQLPAMAVPFFGLEQHRQLLIAMNNCKLLSYPEVTGDPNGIRASGLSVCPQCHQNYFDHPKDWRLVGYSFVPFLRVLCDGTRVKL